MDTVDGIDAIRAADTALTGALATLPPAAPIAPAAAAGAITCDAATPTVAPNTADNPLEPIINAPVTIIGAQIVLPITQEARAIQRPIAVKGLAAVTRGLLVGLMAN